MQLRRGDSRTLTISNLRLSNGSAATFQSGDILRWSLKREYADLDVEVLIAKTSDDGGVTFAIGGSTGTVIIKATDWAAVTIDRMTDCVADLELTRPGSPVQVATLWAALVPVLPDVTVTPHS